MNAICAASEGNVGSGVYEQPGSGALGPKVRRGLRCVAYNPHCFASERLQFTSRQVFLAQLNVVHPTARRLADFFQKPPSPSRLVISKLGAISYVIEKQEFRSLVLVVRRLP